MRNVEQTLLIQLWSIKLHCGLGSVYMLHVPASRHTLSIPFSTLKLVMRVICYIIKRREAFKCLWPTLGEMKHT